MGGMVPLGDATRRPARVPLVTALIIFVNALVFVLELMRGETFVMQWSAVPAQIVSGHHWITILTAMFMHGSWSHIIGNMIFLWAFAPEIEDAMGRGRYLVFYLAGGLVAMLAQVLADPHSTVPNLGASGAIAAVMGAFLVTRRNGSLTVSVSRCEPRIDNSSNGSQAINVITKIRQCTNSSPSPERWNRRNNWKIGPPRTSEKSGASSVTDGMVAVLSVNSCRISLTSGFML
jgi:hypothetical protein